MIAVRARRIVILCLILVFGTGATARAAKVDWRTDLNEAARESVRTGKPLLLKFTASWCGYCKKMERTTYADNTVARHVNECFVPVKVDADQNEKLVKSLAITGLPTTIVVSPEMKVLGRIKGYKSAEAVGRTLNDVCQVDHEEPAPVADRPAFGGYCLVTLRKERRLQAGDPRITVTHRNRTIAFADEAARAEFNSDPAHYWPMWDGNCPVASVDEGRTIEGAPATGAIYRDRLWFFADPEHRAEFDQAPTRYLPSVADREANTRTR